MNDLLARQAGLWPAITGHPFVVAAADGSLPREAFDRWLVEDHFFVVGFRRFVGRLVAIAPDEHARDVLSSTLGPLQAELDLFRAEAARRGLDLAAEPSPTALGYTSFLLACIEDGWPVAVTVLYGAEKAYFDAWSAVRAGADTDSSYWSFIDNWSSPAFGRWVDDVAGLVPPPTEPMHTAFNRVVRLEVRFWDAVLSGDSW
ncbi:MAG: transcriptional regulator [Actinobacteria bacterium]|nr:transcriptional regulator [Actinomycetota bacterium]